MKQLLKLISISLVSLVFLTSCVKPAIDDINNSSVDETLSKPTASTPVSSAKNTSEDVNNSFIDETSSKPTVSGPVSSAEYTRDELLVQLLNDYFPNVELEKCFNEKDYEKFHRDENTDDNWAKFDVNDDGVDELVLQDSDQIHYGFKLIFAIFSAETGKITRRYLDDVEMGRGAFISKNDKLVDYYFYYSVSCSNSYTNWRFDENWEFEEIIDLYIRDIYSLEQLGEEWCKENPEMSEVGVYRFITHYEKNKEGKLIKKKEKISQEEFDKEFERMMGVPFSQMLPEWVESSKKGGRWDKSL